MGSDERRGDLRYRTQASLKTVEYYGGVKSVGVSMKIRVSPAKTAMLQCSLGGVHYRAHKASRTMRPLTIDAFREHCLL